MKLNINRILSLSHIPRIGWLLRGVPKSLTESVAEHIFLVSLLTLLIGKELHSNGLYLNLSKALTIALLHDVPEAVEGDIVKWVKDRVEGVKHLDIEALKELGLETFSQYVDELNKLKSIEAVIVKIADNLATYLQGRVYLELGYKDVSDIIEGTANTIEKYVNTLPRKYKEVLTRYLSIFMEQKVVKNKKPDKK